MNNVICIPGTCSKEEYYNEKYPTASHSHFFPWIQKQLYLRNISCVCMQHFMQYDSNLEYEKWVKEFETIKHDTDSIIVAHSSGCCFVLRYLSENIEKNFGKIIFLAPYLQDFEGEDRDFYSYKLDLNLDKKIEITCLYSLNDSKYIHKSIKILKECYKNIEILEFENKGHFCYSDIGDTFPKLLEEILK
ncbi:MAG: alpha/beta hydrolase [Nanoarchaeota archaeon]|nr:alpha/beta hydrolase [Nanoarchaeota archaeon]